MKKHPWKLLLGSTALAAASVVQAEPPTRLFVQETGEVSKEMSIDLDYNLGPSSSGLAGGLRIGAFGGEVLLNSKTDLSLDGSGFDGSNIGYKAMVMPNLAAYGILSHEKVEGFPSTTNFAIGASYTMRIDRLMLNGNVEYVTDDQGFNGRGDESTLFLKGGVGYLIPSNYGRFTAIGELVLEDNDFLDTVVNLGLRWEPRKNISVDFVLVNERGDNGSMNGLPGAVRLNIVF
jgi:hypothetical protein